MVGAGTGLFDDSVDGGLGLVMSALSGVAAALAVAILFSIYFRSGYRSPRDIVKHGLAVTLVLALLAFVVYDMRHAALAYLGINPTKPAVEFEIRLPKAALTAVARSHEVAKRPPPGPSVPTKSVSQNRQTARPRSRSRPVHRLQLVNRQNTAARPVWVPSPCSV